jgi:hypothetical protein
MHYRTFAHGIHETMGGHIRSSNSSWYGNTQPLTLWSEIQTGILLILLIGSGVLLSSCMLVRGGNLQPLKTWPPANTAEKKALTLTITVKSADQAAAQSTRQQLLEGQAQKAYMESELFSQVNVPTKDPATLQANVEYREDGSKGLAAISGFICGFTLGIIPGYAGGELISVTTFKDQAGKELGVIRKSETYSFWMQLFLIGVMPFREGIEASARGIYYDLNRATLDQARANGIL